MLLTSDWHLDDNPNNAYRWRVFDHIAEWLKHQPNASAPVIHMLGDITDRKDRHGAALVNRLVDELHAIVEFGASIWILMGNHDKPINGTPFWRFLDHITSESSTSFADSLHFITKPTSHDNGKLILLPYAADPATEWNQVDLASFKAAFMHQTVTGVRGDNGFVLENNKMPPLPKHLKVYSGDIHSTQKIGNVLYIGAPHPTDFGDTYPPQMVELKPDYSIARIIPCPGIQKLMVRVESAEELTRIKVSAGDQIKVVCKVPMARLEAWPRLRDDVLAWADGQHAIVASIEPEIEGSLSALGDSATGAKLHDNDPFTVLQMFGEAEELDARMLQVGKDLLTETIDAKT